MEEIALDRKIVSCARREVFIKAKILVFYNQKNPNIEG